VQSTSDRLNHQQDQQRCHGHKKLIQVRSGHAVMQSQRVKYVNPVQVVQVVQVMQVLVRSYACVADSRTLQEVIR
jgi:hypothetical protein